MSALLAVVKIGGINIVWGTVVALVIRLLTVGLLVVSVAGAAQAQERVGSAPYLAMTVASGVDLAVTLDGINSGRMKEWNPVLSHGGNAGLVAGKVASTAVIAWGMQRLGKHGHPKLAKVFGYAATAVFSAASIRNVSVGR